MRTNPLFQEGIQVYLVEGHGFVAYFYLLLFLASLEFLTLFLPSLDPQAWMGPANLFKVSSVAALMLVIYFTLRIANQEFVPWRFVSLKRWLHQEGLTIFEVAVAQLSLLCLHAFLLVFLCAPLLLWAGAIARATAGSILSMFLLILFYSLAYGIWGLVALILWEHGFENRQVFVRSLFISLVFLSALVYLPLNPVAFLLSRLSGEDMAPLVLWGWQWPAPSIHFLFHFLLLGSALPVYRWALKRGSSL